MRAHFLHAMRVCSCWNLFRTVTALLLIAAAVASSSSSMASSFDSQTMCPATAEDWSVLDARLVGVTRPDSCIVECALRANCSALHFNQTAGSCWLAANRQWQERWQAQLSPDCLSFTRQPSPDQQLPGSLLPSLVLWFSFRYSLSNLIINGSGRPDVLASLRLGAVRNASGVTLNTSSAAYIALTVQAGGFESLFPAGRFSVYMKVIRRPRPREVNYLHTLDSGKSVTYMTEETDGRFTVGCRAHANAKWATVSPLLTAPIAAGPVSVGFSYDGSAFHVFHNASLHATSSAGNIPSASVGSDIGIGAKPGDLTGSLDGRVLCFGLANKSFSVADFMALESVCT